MIACPELEASYLEHEQWPQTALFPRPCPGRVVDYRRRFRQVQHRLLQPHDKICIQFRDLVPEKAGKRPEFKTNVVSSHAALRGHLGDDAVILTTGSDGPKKYSIESGYIASEQDPQCRLIYLSGDSSRSHLWIDKQSLTRLFTWHQVMPEYLDFLELFGKQKGMSDPVSFGFQQNSQLVAPDHPLRSPSLGRSGTYVEMCYSLRSPARPDTPVATGGPPGPEPPAEAGGHEDWSIRPAAIYHRYDLQFGKALWVVTHGHKSLFQKFKVHTRPDSRECDRDFSTPTTSFRTTLGVHCLHAQWSQSQWGSFIQYLTNHVEAKTGSAVVEDRDRSPARQKRRQEYRLRELADYQHHEEQCQQTLAAIEDNIETLKALTQHYRALSTDRSFGIRNDCKQNFSDFQKEISRIIVSLKSDLQRIRHLKSTLAGRKALMTQYISHQTTDRMELLTLSTRDIAVESKSEASTMRIFTVVTLFFLPVTFISTVFSTNLFSFSDSDSNPNSQSPSSFGISGFFNSRAFGIWLGTSLTLTLLTLGAARWYHLKSVDEHEETRSRLPHIVFRPVNAEADARHAKTGTQPLMHRPKGVVAKILRFMCPCLLGYWARRWQRLAGEGNEDPEKGTSNVDPEKKLHLERR